MLPVRHLAVLDDPSSIRLPRRAVDIGHGDGGGLAVTLLPHARRRGRGDGPLVIKLPQADAAVDAPEDAEDAGQHEAPVDLAVAEAHPLAVILRPRVLRLEVVVVLLDGPLEALLLADEAVLAAAEVAVRLDPRPVAEELGPEERRVTRDVAVRSALVLKI